MSFKSKQVPEGNNLPSAKFCQLSWNNPGIRMPVASTYLLSLVQGKSTVRIIPGLQRAGEEVLLSVLSEELQFFKTSNRGIQQVEYWGKKLFQLGTRLMKGLFYLYFLFLPFLWGEEGEPDQNCRR